MKVLVINCGSSSLKFQLIDAETETVIAKGLCERIGIMGSRLVYAPKNEKKITVTAAMPSHVEAVQRVLDALVSKGNGVLSSLDEIGAIGHRIVHGGEKFASSTLITDDVIRTIEECSELAPLHNPANLIGITACERLIPGTPMAAVFDTAFHQTMPEEAYLYGIPYDYYRKYKIRRYGFHGTSHSYVSKKAAEMLGGEYGTMKIIVCHLGNGASVSAVKNGISIDTSMGMTPLEGLIMGTRSGNIDPSIIEFIAHKEGKTLEEIMDILNKRSGMLGLSEGPSSDFRDLLESYEAGEEGGQRALRAFAYHVIKYIGAYAAAMDGVDAICFTAGIGENSAKMREMVCSRLNYLGITLDPAANETSGQDVVITTKDSRVKALAIQTNEELMIARETYALVKK